MDNLKATIKGDITQIVFSSCILVVFALCFAFIPGILPVFVFIILAFSAMAVASIVLNALELKRTKDVINRIALSLHGAEKKITVEVKKAVLLSRPAPKFDEYLVGAVLYDAQGKSYVYCFPKAIDASGPIRKDICKKLTAKPLKLVCIGDLGVINEIHGFSIDRYPVTPYRPSIFRRRK